MSMSEDKKLNETIRVQKRKNNFVMMDKTFLEDDRLSYKAKGILAYLLSKPDNWKVIIKDLVNHSKDGVKAIYSGLNELKKYGYYKKQPIRDEQGRHIVAWESVIYEIPNKEIENTENPENTEVCLLSCFRQVENVYIQNQFVENGEHSNNNINNNDSSKNQSSQSSPLLLEEPKREKEDGQDGQTIVQAYEAIVKENVEYDGFLRPQEKALVCELVSIMLDAITAKGEYIPIEGEKKHREHVRSQLLKLRREHIIHVMDKFKSLDSPITKKKQYLLAMLYNTSMELELHYAQY